MSTSPPASNSANKLAGGESPPAPLSTLSSTPAESHSNREFVDTAYEKREVASVAASSASYPQLRKRHSPTSLASTSVLKRDDSGALRTCASSSAAQPLLARDSEQATADFSKLRKISSPTVENDTHFNEDQQLEQREQQPNNPNVLAFANSDGQPQAVSPLSALGSSGRRNSQQLKYLTDYFPNQQTSDFRLTRSRTTRNQASPGEGSSSATSAGKCNNAGIEGNSNASSMHPHNHHHHHYYHQRHQSHAWDSTPAAAETIRKLQPDSFAMGSSSTSSQDRGTRMAELSRKFRHGHHSHVGHPSGLFGQQTLSPYQHYAPLRGGSVPLPAPPPPPLAPTALPPPSLPPPTTAIPGAVGMGVLQFAPSAHLPAYTPMPIPNNAGVNQLALDCFASGGAQTLSAPIPTPMVTGFHHQQQQQHRHQQPPYFSGGPQMPPQPSPMQPHPLPQQQHLNLGVAPSSSSSPADLTAFASRLAAAVVAGGSSVANQSISSAIFGSHSGYRPNSHVQPHSGPTVAPWDPMMGMFGVDLGVPPSAFPPPLPASVNFSRLGLRPPGSYHPLNARASTSCYPSTSSPSTASASMFGSFGLRSQHHVNRATSFLGSLVPKMQHLLSSGSSGSGSAGSGSTSGNNPNPHHSSSGRVMSIVEGLRSSNEIRQAEAASELAEMLLLGNEDNLPNLPMREIIQCLMNLLQKDHNFELMLTAVRCITNLQEALPRSIPLITDAIPHLLQKLKRIEYIEIAEQSLIALEVMSRRNARHILSAGGISSTISHVDFFSLPSQRLAFQVAANCAAYVGAQEFPSIRDCLSDLTQRLNNSDDKRCIESISTFFNRLISNMRNHPDRLREIAGPNYDFLKRAQQLLTVQPLTIGPNSFLSLLKSLRYMCTKCGDIAIALIGMDVGRTIRFLLIGPEKMDSTASAVVETTGQHRPPQQLREIIELVGELMPNLPEHELFNITPTLNHYMSQQSTPSPAYSLSTVVGGMNLERWEQLVQRARYPYEGGAVNWFVKADSRSDEWRGCPARESNQLEQARLAGELITTVEMDGEAYEFDLVRMVRRNLASGVETVIERRVASIGTPHSTSKGTELNAEHPSPVVDEREQLRAGGNEAFLEMVTMLFPMLVDLGTASTCPSIRYETLRVMIRMVCTLGAEEEIKMVLSNVPLAVFISSLLSAGNRSLGVTVSALQLVHLLLEKLADVYIPLLESEGVFHEIEKLVAKATTPRNQKSLPVQAQDQTPAAPGGRVGSSSSTPSTGSSTSSATRSRARSTKDGEGNVRHGHYTRRAAAAAAAAAIAGSSSGGAGENQMEVDTSGAALTNPSSRASYRRELSSSHSAAVASNAHARAAAMDPLPMDARDTFTPATSRPHAIPELNAAQALQVVQPPMFHHRLGIPPPITLPSRGAVLAGEAGTTAAMAAALTPSTSGGSNVIPQKSAARQEITDGLQEFIRKESAYILGKYAVVVAKNALSTPRALGSSPTAADETGAETPGRFLLRRLGEVASLLRTEGKDVGVGVLTDLRDILMGNESLSAFQLSHSGITTALNAYLTKESTKIVPARPLRLRRFLATFMLLTPETARQPSLLLGVGSGGIDDATAPAAPFKKLVSKVLLVIGQQEQFYVKITNLGAIIHSGADGSGGASSGIAGLSASAMAAAAAALGGSSSAIATLASTSTTYLRGAQALRFFQTNQIRCNLRRHPSCKTLREWRHGRGSVKVDPFTSIGSIERYLVDRGLAVAVTPATGSSTASGSGSAAAAQLAAASTASGTDSAAAGEDSGSENDEMSDEEEHDELPYSSGSYEGRKTTEGRIELYIGDNRLPSEMSILQAIRQYAMPVEDEANQLETIPSYLWLTAHTIYYKNTEGTNTPGEEEPTSGGSPSATSTSSMRGVSSEHRPSPPWTLRRSAGSAESSSAVRAATSPPSRKMPRIGRIGSNAGSGSGKKTMDKYSVSITKDSRVFKDGCVPSRTSPLEQYLREKLDYEIDTSSTGCFLLLRTLYGLNNFWWCLFQEEVPLPTHGPILPPSAFHSAKLNSKVTRQLSDFFSVATQQIPKWTCDLLKAIPFAFPFQTRRALLYCTAFGRDRALMHLVNESEDQDGQQDASSRLIPRLERRKITISRTTLLKDAQTAFVQLGASKAMLEVAFDGEVGTGYGPTLEFYSTISRELQRHSLRLWHGRAERSPEVEADDAGDENVFTASEAGLFPNVYRPPSSKQMEARLKKFEFVGRLLAQSLIDSKMLDFPLASPFFKWMLGEEERMGADDLEKLDPDLYQSLRNMSDVPEEDFNGLDVYFTYPHEGNAFELVKGGKHKPVTKENFPRFVELVTYWRLVEGVRPEMEAVRRGFTSIIDANSLRLFYPDEMEQLFCGQTIRNDDKWSHTVLQQCIRPDHGFTHDSPQIAWLIKWLHSSDIDKKRRFLQFVTGSPRLPVGGFRSLNPPLTVVRKTASYCGGENELPSAMTCYNYLKIPPYETYAIFAERFGVALQHVYSFHLT